MKFVTGDTLREFREFRKRTGIRDPVIGTFLLMEPPRVQFPEPMASPVQVKFVCMGHWVQQDQESGLWYPWGEVPQREEVSYSLRDIVERLRASEKNVYDAQWGYKSRRPAGYLPSREEIEARLRGNFEPQILP